MEYSQPQKSQFFLIVCAVATLLSFFSFGALSLFVLFIALFIEHGYAQNKLNRAVKVAITVHLLVIAFFVPKLFMIHSSGVQADSIFEIILTHWVLDYLSELAVSVYLLFHLIKSERDSAKAMSASSTS